MSATNTAAPNNLSDEERRVFELIERETTAFLSRDYEAWADCWLQDDSTRRLGACMGGVMDYHEGWATANDMIIEIFKSYPKPNIKAAQSMHRDNISIRIFGDMAWISYDQYGKRDDDPLVTVGLSHQIRILEKHKKKWKIAMAGHGDTNLEYFDYPVIRVDVDGRIKWMNDAARRELPHHPALMVSGAFLRAQYQRDKSLLISAIQDVSNLTVMDRRPSITNPRGRSADPVILKGNEADGEHIVWISKQDGMLLVSFRDHANEKSRLEQAQQLFNLSPAQSRLAVYILEGYDLPKIAAEMGISLNTAKTHLSRIFDKTGVRNQPALISKLLGIQPPQ